MKPTHAREVRLIGGQFKRSKLPVLGIEGLRPTPDRVRETLFNWLGQDLTGWRCLDAFAGSGALGFEAASRGAAEVWLLERDARQVASLRQSQARLKAEAVRVQAGEAISWMSAQAPSQFDLVFLDPPFASQLQAAAVRAATPLLRPNGWLYVEAAEALTAAPHERLRLQRHGRAGAVHFHLLQLN
jgi:16S rRNA (guanine966-N2)-methyltransferase